MELVVDIRNVAFEVYFYWTAASTLSSHPNSQVILQVLATTELGSVLSCVSSPLP